jgi:formate dehydrogenase
MYEREDLNIVNIGTSHQPYAQFTPAVVPPRAERREEWWIAHRLLQELGLPNVLDDDADPWGKWAHLLRKGSGIELADLQESGEVVVLDPPTPGSFFDAQVQTLDGRVDCRPAAFDDAIARCHELFAESRRDDRGGELLLIHKRDGWMHNSWMVNLERMHRSGTPANPLGICPTDAERLGLDDGDAVVVSSDHGEITATVEVDETLMDGVVSMVHGWGHAVSPRLRVAHADPGSNPNALLPSGPGSFEPLSSQAHMTGIPVSVSPAAS